MLRRKLEDKQEQTFTFLVRPSFATGQAPVKTDPVGIYTAA